MFGSRAYLKNNYLYRMAAAVLGIYSNSKEEAIYLGYFVDADGKNRTAPTSKPSTLARASYRPSTPSGR
jgi:hypothetical protein